MASATITTKGQITIPIEIRNELNLKTGDKLYFYKTVTGDIGMYAKNQSVTRLKGMFGKFARTVSIEEMNEAIARGAAGLPEPEDEAASA